MRPSPLPLLLLTAMLALAGCNNQTAPASRDSISVSGHGDIKAQPDIFRVVATPRRQGDDIDAMKQDVDDQVTRMLDLADSLEIARKQVTANELRVTPVWQYQPQRKLTGHQVSRQVSFRVDGLETYARLLDGLSKLGVRDIRPAGSEISNQEALAKQALKKAVADARERATIAAEAAGRKLGKAIQIQVQGRHLPQPVMMMARAKDSSAESYRAGESQVTAQVQVTFELD
ncbi:MAG: SIMPL domain-containing protein [Alcanivorax sp.]|nr:SIMPL domain-containing protein [Alcanivorax sp.]